MSETRISASRFSARSAPTKSSTNSSAGAIRISAGVAYCSTLPPSLHDRDPVAHLDRLVDVVGDEEDGLADLRLQAQELVLQALAADRVDRPEGLVHQHHQRVRGERPGDPDALLLAAGELRRVALAELGVEPDQLQQLGRAGPGPLLLPAEQLRHGADVLGDRAVGEEADLLDHVADLPPQLRRVAVAHRLAADRGCRPRSSRPCG